MEKTLLKNLVNGDKFYIVNDTRRCFGNRIRYMITTNDVQGAVDAGHYIECAPVNKKGQVTGFGFYTYVYELEVETITE